MEARVLKHYLLLHDAAAEGEDGADRSGAENIIPVHRSDTTVGLLTNSERVLQPTQLQD